LTPRQPSGSRIPDDRVVEAAIELVTLVATCDVVEGICMGADTDTAHDQFSLEPEISGIASNGRRGMSPLTRLPAGVRFDVMVH
jgi:hypothetical protein